MATSTESGVYGNGLEDSWNWWVSRLMPVTLGDPNLFRYQHLLRERYSHEGLKEVEVASSNKKANSRYNPRELEKVLKNPSPSALRVVKMAVLRSIGHHEHFVGLMRLSVIFTQGTESTLYGGTMRTEALDRELLAAIEEFKNTAELYDLDTRDRTMEGQEGIPVVRYATRPNSMNSMFSRIYKALAAAPVLFVAKFEKYGLGGAPDYTRREVLFPKVGEKREQPSQLAWSKYLIRNLPQEWQLLKDLAEYTAELPIEFFPRAYALNRYQKRTVLPNSTEPRVLNLVNSLSNSPGGDKNGDVLYMQYLEGPTLESAAGLSPEVVNATIGYLHHALAYLKKNAEFAHGDLSPSNIILCGYDLYNPQRYTLPILDEDGEILKYIVLPFKPMMTGLEYGVTRDCAQYSPTTSTHPGELSDIIYLYTSSVRSSKFLAYPFVKETLAPYYREFRQELTLPVSWRLAPYGWAIEELNHSILATYYRDAGVFDSFETEMEEEPDETPLIHVQKSGEDLAEIASKMKKFFHIDPNGYYPEYAYVFSSIWSYLDETERFYK